MATGGDYGVDNDVFAGDDSSQLFSKAQLLQGGHAICLHALRYRVAAVPRPRGTGEKAGCPTNDDAVLPRPPQWVCDVRVDAPSWAEPSLLTGGASSDLDALFNLSTLSAAQGSP